MKIAAKLLAIVLLLSAAALSVMVLLDEDLPARRSYIKVDSDDAGEE